MVIRSIGKKTSNACLYPGQGFIESLIAIMIAGIASVALMQIAANAIAEVTRLEIEDQLTQESVEGGEILKFAVDEYNFDITYPTAPIFPVDPLDDVNKCYGLDGTIGSPIIPDIDICTYSTTSGIDPKECSQDSASVVDDSDGDFFRILCIHPDTTDQVLVGKIFTGFVPCAGDEACQLSEFTVVYGVKK